MRENNQPLTTTDLQLQFLLNASPVGRLVFNLREEITAVNPPAEKFFSLCSNIDSPQRWGDFIRCTNRLTTPRGCGHSISCPSCPLLGGLRAILAGTATTDDQEGEASLARRMLQIRPPDLPIILCTGCSNLVTEEQAKNYGIKGFAMKPLTMKEVSTLLRMVLNLDEGAQ